MRGACAAGTGIVAALAAFSADAAPPRPVAPAVRPHVAPLRPGPRILRRRGFGPLVGRRRFLPNAPPLLLPNPPPDEFVQPPGPGPSPLIEDVPDQLPAFSHGFHFSIPIGAGQTYAVPATLQRYIEVGQALGACFSPPPDLPWGSITLRVSLKRDGSVNGEPRIPFSDAPSLDQKADLAHSLLDALKRCTPLHLSPSLGGSIAGEIFAIRFIHQDRK